MDRVCPLLALGADRRTAVDGVDAGHRCHALEPPGVLERDRQSQLCLTTGHQRCERYLAHLARTNRPTRTDLPIGDGLRSTRLVLAPEPSWRGMAGRARRSPRSLVAVLLIVGVALGGATAVAAGIAAPREAAALPSPSTDPAATTPEATPTEAPTRAPAPTPTPKPPTPAPPATAAPATPPPTAAPTPRTYVVVAGDTLALIAQRFGVTVAALQSMNGIEDPNEILIGQVLVIP